MRWFATYDFFSNRKWDGMPQAAVASGWDDSHSITCSMKTRAASALIALP